MDEKLAAELVEMAEVQFAAQAPLAELMEEDPAFAAWVRRVLREIAELDGQRLPWRHKWTRLGRWLFRR